MARLFFALWPDATVRAALADRARLLGEQVAGARCTHAANLHLTLCFVGSVPEQRVAEVLAVGAAATASSVTLRLDRLEHWPAPAVVCLVPSQVPRALVALATQLAAMLRARGLPADQRPWRPHLTLCRHLRRLDAEQVQSLQSRMSAEVIDWPVREFVLAESAHDAGASAYRLLARWPLSDPAAVSPP